MIRLPIHALLTIVSLGCFHVVGFSTAPAVAQNLFFQNEDPLEDLFLLAPRSLTRLLREGERAIQEGRYTDGINALSRLLLDENNDLPEDIRGQDFFVEPLRSGFYNKSVKGEAIRLLGELPEQGRKILQIQFGVTARQALDRAIAQQDLEQIASVARKYIHTEAGYDAQVLMAQHKLTGGYPLAAAAILHNLLDFPAARQRYGVELARASAQAWVQAGNEAMAVVTLEQAVRDFSGSSLTLGGQQIALDAATDWKAILDNQDESQLPLTDRRTADSWLTAGGSPERNAVARAGMPLSTARWVTQTHGSEPEKEALLDLAETERQRGNVLLPKLEMRAVDNLVLAKTTDSSVLGIDFETGITDWVFYYHSAPVPLNSYSFSPGIRGENSSTSEELQKRVWGSSAFGQLGCDSQRFYFVGNEDEFPIRAGMAGGSLQRSGTNYLDGVSIESQGAILWRVGGASGEDEPQLAGAFFLGPPLSYGGQLYSLVEINGETKLVVLDAATGKLRWSQQLVHAMMPPLQFDSERTTQALTPTIADGVILCPTGAGAVVAVDLLSRSLRWGVTYRTNRSSNANAFRQGAFGSYGAEYMPLRRRWQDPGMIANQGIVAISPPESDVFFCNDILTGASVLAAQRRGSNRYIAGLKDGQIFLVGERQVVAKSLQDHRIVWNCAFPDGRTLAGKGIWQADSLILPLTGQQVVRINLNDGSIVDQATVDQPLGNLFAYKDQLVSVSGTSVAAFYTREALAEEVSKRLQDSPDDTWALNQASQLAVAEGDLQRAIELLSESFQLDPESADTCYLLVETLLTGLEADFEKYEYLARELDGIVEFGPQRFRFLQRLALGNIQAGQHLAAFERLIELMRDRIGTTYSGAQNRAQKLRISDRYTVDSDTWIAAELARSYAAATADEQAQMRDLIAQELNSVEGVMIPLRRQKLRFLAWLPAAEGAIFDLAERLLGGEEQTTAEHLLQPLLFSSEPQSRDRAREMLGRLPMADRLVFSGEGAFRRRRVAVAGGFDDPVEQPADSAPQNVRPISWNRGMVEAHFADGGLYRKGFTLDQTAQRYGRPDIALALSGSSVVVFNGQGEDVRHLEYSRASTDSTDLFTRTVVRGGLLLLETSTEVVALDLYRGLVDSGDAILWRHSLFTPEASPGRRYEPAGVSSVNGPLGFPLSRRQMAGKKQAIVGPLTPVGIVVQSGTKIVAIDALTGRQLWTRDGYDNNVRLTSSGLEVAIVNPSLAMTEIVDCRDGALVRQLPYREDTEHWCAHGGMMVDFKERQGGVLGSGIQTRKNTPVTLRIWNALTGETFRELDLARGSRADICDGRYLVVVEPGATLHFVDLEDLKYVRSEVEVDAGLDSIVVQRFQDRLVVLSDAAGAGNTNRDAQGVKICNASKDLTLVNGTVYGIDTQSGELIWSQSGRLFNMYFAKSQPRQSPFMVTYRFNPGPLQRSGTRASVALVDLRDGRLVYSASSIPLSATAGFAMVLRPTTQTIVMCLGVRTLVFKMTDQPRPPQPIFTYGYIYPDSRSMPLRDRLR